MKIQSLTITPEMLGLIAEIDEFKGAWRALKNLAPARLNQLQKIATIESVGSSTRIEGSKLSDREVEKVLRGIGAQSFATRDEQEVAGYAAAMEVIFSSFDAIPINENHIKQLHTMLLQYSDKDTRHRGTYKTLPNAIEAFDADGRSLGVIFEPTTPFDTPRQMADLCNWIKDATANKTIHPLLIAGVVIVTFLAIHPFQDGNGRLSRILSTLLLLKSGYAYVPYSSLESIIEQNKNEYYLALRRTQATLKSETPNWSPWILFFLRSLHKQKQNLEIKVEREHLIRSRLPELSVKLLEMISANGAMALRELVTATGAPRPTVKDHLSSLVNTERLRSVGRGRNTKYILK